jgi:hypothetical protein
LRIERERIVGKNDRLSRDQKRKAKLKKRSERSGKHESLAYHGKKYKAPEFVPILHRTEIGIHESDVMLDRELTDDEVEAALERLIIRLRQKAIPTLAGKDLTTDSENEPDELLHWNIRRNWQIVAERGELPGRDDLIGVLRTILHSLEIWRGQSLHARGYLQFLEGFMKETGVQVQSVDPREVEILDIEDKSPRGLGHDRNDDEGPR